MLLIGLGHKARHGKDTFANIVVRRNPHLNIRLVSFADELRREIRAAARQIWEEINPGWVFMPQKALKLLCVKHRIEFEEDAVVEPDYPWGKQRRLHQWWGTEYRRSQDENYWCKRGQALIEKARLDGVDVLIFRDMRFHNEYDMIGSEGGLRVKISRLGYVSDVPPHISETELDDRPFDLLLGVRDGDLPLLESTSVALFNHIWHLYRMDRAA